MTRGHKPYSQFQSYTYIWPLHTVATLIVEDGVVFLPDPCCGHPFDNRVAEENTSSLFIFLETNQTMFMVRLHYSVEGIQSAILAPMCFILSRNLFVPSGRANFGHSTFLLQTN
jgi:hypothetical protein